MTAEFRRHLKDAWRVSDTCRVREAQLLSLQLYRPRRMRPTQVAPEPGRHSVTWLKQATATSQFLERLPQL